MDKPLRVQRQADGHPGWNHELWPHPPHFV